MVRELGTVMWVQSGDRLLLVQPTQEGISEVLMTALAQSTLDADAADTDEAWKEIEDRL